jgi:hypothetical protein
VVGQQPIGALILVLKLGELADNLFPDQLIKGIFDGPLGQVIALLLLGAHNPGVLLELLRERTIKQQQIIGAQTVLEFGELHDVVLHFGGQLLHYDVARDAHLDYDPERFYCRQFLLREVVQMPDTLWSERYDLGRLALLDGSLRCVDGQSQP